MTLRNTTQQHISSISIELQDMINKIVTEADTSTFLWRLAVIDKIKLHLAEAFNYDRVAQRLLFGTSINGNQVFFGSFIHYGKKVVLFVPSIDYLCHLSFVEIERGKFSNAITVSSRPFCSVGNTRFTLHLDSRPIYPPYRLNVVSEGDKTFLDVPDSQGELLYEWFSTIL